MPTPPIDMVTLKNAVNSNVTDVTVLKSYMNSNLAAAAASNFTKYGHHLMVSSGYARASGYVSSTGNVYQWGANSVTNNILPNQFNTGSLVSKNVISISSGQGHTIAVDSTGTVHAWGTDGAASALGWNILGPVGFGTPPYLKNFDQISMKSKTQYFPVSQGPDPQTYIGL